MESYVIKMSGKQTLQSLRRVTSWNVILWRSGLPKQQVQSFQCPRSGLIGDLQIYFTFAKQFVWQIYQDSLFFFQYRQEIRDCSVYCKPTVAVLQEFLAYKQKQVLHAPNRPFKIDKHSFYAHENGLAYVIYQYHIKRRFLQLYKYSRPRPVWRCARYGRLA